MSCMREPHTVRVLSIVCHCAARLSTDWPCCEPWLLGTTLRLQGIHGVDDAIVEDSGICRLDMLQRVDQGQRRRQCT